MLLGLDEWLESESELGKVVYSDKEDSNACFNNSDESFANMQSLGSRKHLILNELMGNIVTWCQNTTLFVQEVHMNLCGKKRVRETSD